jgi:hypothetical protein
MKTAIPPKAFSKAINMLVTSVAKTATLYLAPNLVVRSTWRHKPKANHTREEMVVTFGRPNYLETIFAKQAVKAGEPFPIRKVQLKAWPVKRKVKPLQK